MTAVLALLLAADQVALVSVHTRTLEQRTAVEIVTTASPMRVGVERAGAEVVVTLDARLPKALGPVAASPPLQSVVVRREGTGVAVHVRVDPRVPYEVRREGALLTVMFGEKPAAPLPPVGQPAADVQELYQRLLPPPSAEPSGPPAVVPETGTAQTARDPQVQEPAGEGLQVGLLTLRPALSGLYVDAEATLDTPRPVRDQYYEVRPQLAGELPVGTGRLRVDYEVRLRRESAFEVVENTTTHLANGDLELPIGASLLARAAGHFSRGVLETTEVDPGREYFFQLGRFRRHDESLGLRIEVGGRFDLDLGASRHTIHVDDRAGFFSHEWRAAAAALGLELGPRLRGAFGYSYEEIPPPRARAEAEMQAHSGSLSLQGEILPLVTGTFSIGYRDQRNPQAGGGGTRYRGLAASVRLLKEFSRAATLLLVASRATPPSSFESNGFYVSNSIEGELNLPVPLSFVVRGGAGYHWNDYRVVSPEIGLPREDRIIAWSAGIGRPITSWGYLRADYRYDRRDSNLGRFDTDAHALTVQAGIRLYRPAERR